jgi:hypothetical protein
LAESSNKPLKKSLNNKNQFMQHWLQQTFRLNSPTLCLVLGLALAGCGGGGGGGAAGGGLASGGITSGGITSGGLTSGGGLINTTLDPCSVAATGASSLVTNTAKPIAISGIAQSEVLINQLNGNGQLNYASPVLNPMRGIVIEVYRGDHHIGQWRI